jgi:hypothetical protein
MTIAVNTEETGKKIAEAIPGSVISSDKGRLPLTARRWRRFRVFLRIHPDWSSITLLS